MRVKWTRTALEDLDTAAEYIARDNIAASARVVTRVKEAAKRLSDNPAIGRPGIAGTRELVVSNTPYIIPYRVRESAVEILRVLHTISLIRKYFEKAFFREHCLLMSLLNLDGPVP